MTWLDYGLTRWFAWRDRWLTDPAFQRAAGHFPLTRFMARRRARELFDLTAGFVYAQTLLAVVRLELLEMLADGPRTPAQLRARLNLPGDNAERLLRAATALRLLEHRPGGQLGLGPLGSALAGNAGVRAMILHHAPFYADLADPVALLQGVASTRLSAYWPYATAADPSALNADAVADYSRVMAASQDFIAGEILASHDFGQHRRVLDVGGGEGRFVAQVAARHPALELTLFDLPAVVERARANPALAAARISFVAGSFLSDPLPAGADLITLVRVLHDHPDAQVVCLLRAVRESVGKDGIVLLAEPMRDPAGDNVLADAYFGLYLLAMAGPTQAGRARSPCELATLSRSAGFRYARLVPNPLPFLVRILRLDP
jgi:demethylspheroidene O-methyltransferase